jgi:hypothetical protein
MAGGVIARLICMGFFLRVRGDGNDEDGARVSTEGDKPYYVGIFEREERFMEDLNMTAPPRGLYDLNVISGPGLGTEPDQQEPSVAVGPKYSIDTHDHCLVDPNKTDVSIPSHLA